MEISYLNQMTKKAKTMKMINVLFAEVSIGQKMHAIHTLIHSLANQCKE